MSTDLSPDILDLPALKRNFAGDMSFVGRLLTKFQGRYPGQVQTVQEALTRGDSTAAAEAAHRLAGEASVFYAVAARQTALKVEDLARAGQLAEASAACDTLVAELDRLASKLQALAGA
jgi:HPt (histidine-containing phosphotransfer) domain-containing protein